VSGELDEAVRALLEHSLRAWRVHGKIRREAVADAERSRSATSVTGVLRHVRAALDSGYRSVSLRIAPLPPAP